MLDKNETQGVGLLESDWLGFQGEGDFEGEEYDRDELAFSEGDVPQVQPLIPEDEALAENAISVFRRNLSHIDRLTPEQEKELGESMEALYFTMVTAIMVRRPTAKVFVALLKLIVEKPLTLPLVGDKEAYYILLREFQELIKPATKKKALEQAVRVFESFLDSGTRKKTLPDDVQLAIQSIQWPGPLLVAILNRFLRLNYGKGKIDSALQAYMLHYGCAKATKKNTEQTKIFQQYIVNYFQMRDTFVLKNIPLVFSITNRYCLHSASYAEMLQEGIVGLIRAAEKYRASTGNRFSTYAYTWIESKVRLARVRSNSLVPLTPKLNTELSRVHQCIEALKAKGEKPNVELLARRLKSEPTKIQGLLDLKRGMISFDSTLSGDEGSTLHNRYADDALDIPDDIGLSELQQRLQAVLPKVLTPREVRVVNSRFGMNTTKQKTLVRLGKELKVSGENVRLIEQNALNKLKAYLLQHPVGKDLLLFLSDSQRL